MKRVWLAPASILTALALAMTTARGDVGVTALYSFPSDIRESDFERPVTSLVVSNVAGSVTRAPARLDLIYPQANLNTIHSFSAQLTGSGARKGGYVPSGGLVQGRDGSLYGVTALTAGQWDIGGGIYRITTNGGFTPLYQFTVDMAAVLLGTLEPGTIVAGEPRAGLVEGTDGNFYGSTVMGAQIPKTAPNNDEGDSLGAGILFRVSPTGSLTMLACFTNHSHAVDRLVLGRDGNFYGVTAKSEDGYGGDTVFRLTPEGTITILHTFTGANDGQDPEAGLLLGKDGHLYGTTADNHGTVFRLDTTGSLTTLYSFTGGNDGSKPLARLLEGQDGSLYGTTSAGGGPNKQGTIFRLSPQGTLTTLYTFSGGDDGGNPGQLTWSKDGALYGITRAAGPFAAGTLFMITTNGVFSLLNWFDASSTESQPSELIQGQDGSFYGTTSGGGLFGGGTVFQLILATNAPFLFTSPQSQSILPGGFVSFTVSAGGRLPLTYTWEKDGALLRDEGRIYGTTTSCLVISNAIHADAGSYRVTVQNSLGSVTSTGAVLTLILPAAPMKVLYSFQGSDEGKDFMPMGGVTRDNDGNLYGTTWWDGGTIFRLAADGTMSTLYSFGTLTNAEEDALDGFYPWGNLVQGKDGAFYGVTQMGGQFNQGVVFKITAAGAFTTLVSFDRTNGLSPMAGLTVDGDGNLYGTTAGGGASVAHIADESILGYGTIFKITPSGLFSTLHSFNGTNGAEPYSPLTWGPDGNLYGTTLYGGDSFQPKADPHYNVVGTYGTVFKITPNGVLTTLLSLKSTNGAEPLGNLALGTDGNFYGTLLASAADLKKTNGANFIITPQGTNGAVFRITPQGGFTLLHDFTGGDDGGTPLGGLVRGLDGNFYGTTVAGGDYGAGVAFRVTPSGGFTALYSFTGGLDGHYSTSSLTPSIDGSLYGTVAIGGTGKGGTVFQLTFAEPAPKLQILRVGSRIRLSWPATASDFLLESSHALGEHALWSLVAGTPASLGDQFIWTAPVSSLRAFFRLRAK